VKPILVTYVSMAGSTAEVAQAIADELTARGHELAVRPMDELDGLEAFGGAVIGGPMILGWHRRARSFVRQNRAALAKIPWAVFVTAMSLTATGSSQVDGVPITVDPGLPKAPVDPGRLSHRERYATLSNYLRPILAASKPAKPHSIALFAGRMDYGRVPPWARLFAMLIVQAPAGDRRNWDAIRRWARDLGAVFGPNLSEKQAQVPS
jgi:menaquinone-dependent protoporphyrinogen IX oxidase